MSVLIEALCLVIRRSSLDESYIGGADVFVEDRELENVFRYVVSDEDLVAIGVFDADTLAPVVKRLQTIGLAEADADQFTNDFVLVDMETGPTVRCDWLGFELHRHGLALAWLEGSEVQPLATPSEWTPERSWTLHRSDIRDGDPEDILPLAHENGMESILDFRTGRVTNATDVRSPIAHVDPADDVAPQSLPAPVSDDRLAAAARVLTRIGVPFRTDTRLASITVLFAMDDRPHDGLVGYPEGRRLRISVQRGADSESVVVTTVLPLANLWWMNFFKQPVHDKARLDKALAGRGGEVVISRETSTLEIITQRMRNDSESWEQAVESAFMDASGLGTDAFHVLAATRAQRVEDLPTFEDVFGYPEPDEAEGEPASEVDESGEARGSLTDQHNGSAATTTDDDLARIMEALLHEVENPGAPAKRIAE